MTKDREGRAPACEDARQAGGTVQHSGRSRGGRIQGCLPGEEAPGQGGSGEAAPDQAPVLRAMGNFRGTLNNAEINGISASESAEVGRWEGKRGEDKETCPETPQ